jgi:hypothetical protein
VQKDGPSFPEEPDQAAELDSYLMGVSEESESTKADNFYRDSLTGKCLDQRSTVGQAAHARIEPTSVKPSHKLNQLRL